MKPPASPPACRLCRHHYITHDARFPYGCRAMQIKSKRSPALDVREATGHQCVMFDAKPPRQP
ncbi:hypothetical protein [Vogesella urethralis]|uniref:hypothetical protein n=1 Tax=Vogesella urethralis TaxID=2592656 RepID=UPI0011847C92|nr:hypothetical protein [Vogesella urethralis]